MNVQIANRNYVFCNVCSYYKYLRGVVTGIKLRPIEFVLNSYAVVLRMFSSSNFLFLNSLSMSREVMKKMFIT